MCEDYVSVNVYRPAGVDTIFLCEIVAVKPSSNG